MSELLTITDPATLRRWAKNEHIQGRRLALVPTMGYLHEGHLELVRAARSAAHRAIVSIFVNPTQFGANEDLDRYPRDLAGDLVKLREAHADVAFVPEAASLYPTGFDTWVEPASLGTVLCGKSRPGHFRGVATVVAILLRQTMADVAVFGEKDFQQLQVIRRMVRDLYLDIEIVAVPTVRESGGLAMSSRNAYLSADERRQALALSRALVEVRKRFSAGERRAEQLLATARETVAEQPALRVDYIELVARETLQPVAEIRAPALLAVAVFAGVTRLIDNCQLEP